jgi:hypothetical protein
MRLILNATTCAASRRNDHSPGAFSVRNAALSISDNQSGTTSRTTCFVWEGQSSDRFFRMIPINLRLENKLISKNLIAALAPLPRLLGRYREARKSLRGSISQQSRQGLDWMNFFLADVQTAFGAFVAFYLADLGWSKGQVGLTYCWDACWRHQPDSRRGACRCSAVETRPSGDWHRHDLRISPNPCADAELRSRVLC